MIISIKRNEDNVKIKRDGSHSNGNYQNHCNTELLKNGAKYKNKTKRYAQPNKNVSEHQQSLLELDKQPYSL